MCDWANSRLCASAPTLGGSIIAESNEFSSSFPTGSLNKSCDRLVTFFKPEVSRQACSIAESIDFVLSIARTSDLLAAGNVKVPQPENKSITLSELNTESIAFSINIS